MLKEKEALLHGLHRIHPLTPELRQHLTGILKASDLKKREFMLKPGRICENVYFIRRGLIRAFHLKDGDGEEISRWFMKEGDIVFSIESFYDQQPGKEYLQCLEDSSVFYISHKELYDIYLRFPEFNYIGRTLTEKYYKEQIHRDGQMSSHKASDRYGFLLNAHPELFKRVPLTMLSSYLGVTRRTITRIRGRKK